MLQDFPTFDVDLRTIQRPCQALASIFHKLNVD